MVKVCAIFLIFIATMGVLSCSKRVHPSPAILNPDIRNDTTAVVKRTDSSLVIKPVIKRKPKESTPRVIVVNDKFASKSVDGRYYYDLQGHRYWRSNKDGKYYLFNKSMLTDDDFKKPN